MNCVQITLLCYINKPTNSHNGNVRCKDPVTNFIHGFASVGDSSACLQSGKDELSNEVYICLLTDRHNRRAGSRCLFRRTVNVAWGLWAIPLSASSSLAGSPGVTDERSRRSHGISDFFIFTPYQLLLPPAVPLFLDARAAQDTCAKRLMPCLKKELDSRLRQFFDFFFFFYQIKELYFSHCRFIIKSNFAETRKKN